MKMTLALPARRASLGSDSKAWDQEPPRHRSGWHPPRGEANQEIVAARLSGCPQVPVLLYRFARCQVDRETGPSQADRRGGVRFSRAVLVDDERLALAVRETAPGGRQQQRPAAALDL